MNYCQKEAAAPKLLAGFEGVYSKSLFSSFMLLWPGFFSCYYLMHRILLNNFTAVHNIKWGIMPHSLLYKLFLKWWMLWLIFLDWNNFLCYKSYWPCNTLKVTNLSALELTCLMCMLNFKVNLSKPPVQWHMAKILV